MPHSRYRSEPRLAPGSDLLCPRHCLPALLQMCALFLTLRGICHMTTISKPLYHMKLKHFLLPAMVLAILAGCTKDPATTDGGGGNTGENKNEKVELPDGKKI